MTTSSNENTKRAGVNHSYHDYSNMSAADALKLYPMPSTGQARQYNPLASGTQQQGFVVKLFHMMSSVDVRGYSPIVSWQPHGRYVLQQCLGQLG
jgi:hypothetical protein